MNAKRLVTVFVTLVGLIAVGADTYYWIPGSTDWSSAGSYTNATGAAVLPSSGDTVVIPKDCDAVLDAADTTSVDFVNTLGWIQIRESTSRLVVLVASGETLTLNPRVSSSANPSEFVSLRPGGIIKRGTGTLVLGESSLSTSYAADMLVEEGTLKLPREVISWAYYYYGDIVVSNGATLAVCVGKDDDPRSLTYLRSISGSGLITNDCSRGYGIISFDGGKTCEFAGTIGGNIRVDNCTDTLLLTGTNNTFQGIYANYNFGKLESGPLVGLKTIGMKGQPSSAGCGDELYMFDDCYFGRDAAGGYRYLGTGETTDRDIRVEYSSYPSFFDAGAIGGITFLGNLVPYNKAGTLRRFILTGSNAVPCVVKGDVASTIVGAGTPGTFYITKRGSGTWRFAEGAAANMLGGFAVQAGTLQYETIAEAGTSCSLGKATILTDDCAGSDLESHYVDYAYALGGGDSEAVFDYVGTAARSWCFSRPIALKGDACLRHSGTGELRLSNVRPITDGAKTLTLDGTGSDAWLFDLVGTANSPVSLVKDGSGTWTLAGTNAISGTIAVRQGTLRIQHNEAPYTWYRWLHKQTRGHEKTLVWEFGLYDKDGNRVNGDLQSYDDNRAVGDRIKDMPAGSFAHGFMRQTFEGTDYTPLDRLFDGQSATGVTAWKAKFDKADIGQPTTWTAYAPQVDDPKSWVPVVMRLPSDAAEVRSYDLINGGGWNKTWTQGSGAFALEGSVDGFHWTTLHDYNKISDLDTGTINMTWESSRESYESMDPSFIAHHEGGFSVIGHPTDLPVPLADVSEISVASGARLEVTKGVLPLKEGVRLKVSASGAGTLANLEFPETGVLEIIDLPKFGQTLDIALARENVIGFENVAEWTLIANGQDLSSYLHCTVSDGKITISKPGLIMIVR